MAKKITADIISDFFIQKSIEADNPVGGNITTIKLQKLITYAYVWYLGLRGERLFEEQVKKCNHGYFIKSQFERFKDFGFMPIILVDFECNIEDRLNPKIYDFLDNLWDAYGHFQDSYLSKLQCRELPYKEENIGLFVDDSSIKSFYSYKKNISKDLGCCLPEGVCLFMDDEHCQYMIGSTPPLYPLS